MTHEYKCPDCGDIVSPVPFIGHVPPDATDITRKFACTCGTTFLVSINIHQLTLTDFDTSHQSTSPHRTELTPPTVY